jgi:hypothetical protein
MRTFTLLTSVAAAALLTGLSSASAEPVDLTIDDVDQTTANFANIGNYGDIDHFGGSIGGNGASLSISATGAVSSLSVSGINAPEVDSISIGVGETIFQSTLNNGNVLNTHGFDTQVVSGTVSGDGASVSVSATGGASAISVSSIHNQERSFGTDISFGGIQQSTKNFGTINNQGGSITTGNITGDGASVSIGASGAVSSVSVSSVVDANMIDSVAFNADIVQTTTNYNAATINNTGTVQVGNLTGHGASASVSAIGAASAVSYSAISPH